ncbi:hypothetical protein BJX64DRAFT_301271 [Aspergillus heterothallicus]
MNPQVITISSSADARIRTTAIFEVEKAKLIAQSESFRTLFNGEMCEESNLGEIPLEQDQIKAITILFHCLHKGTNKTGLGTPPVNVTDVTTADIWYLVLACIKYRVEMKSDIFKKWFKTWYDAQEKDTKFHAEVMFPAYAFDDASAFKSTTHALVYNCHWHIREYDPTSVKDVHLPLRIIQQLDAARGRLRNVLHNSLFDQAATLLSDDGCNCRFATFYNYFKELKRIEVWPLENTMKHASINMLLYRLTEFDPAAVRAKHLPPCATCDKNWDMVVWHATNDGRDPEHEYWFSHTIKQWGRFCRISHGNPTWYFSYMGRREKRGLISD